MQSKKTTGAMTDLIKEKINKLKKPDSIAFLLFGDLHTDSAEGKGVQTLCRVLGEVSSQTELDMAINLGDNFSMLGRKDHITNDKLEALATELFDKIASNSKYPVFFVGGNHDGVGTEFFTSCFWNKLTKNKYANKDGVYDKDGAYFYTDHQKSGTRLIFLSLPSDSVIGSDISSIVWAFGKKQLTWLKDKALATASDVILIVHTPFLHHYYGNPEAKINVWDGEKEIRVYINDLCGTIKDREEAADIINDFASKNPGKLVAVFSGHTHRDSVCPSFGQNEEGQNPLACPQIIERKFYIEGTDEDAEDFALDIAIYTPSEKNLDLIRIGMGEDRHFSF